ncbi:MAG: hypothetical protein ACOZNI_30860 [Myxococcota bacterium]
MLTPPWLPARPDLRGRADVVDALLAALAEHGHAAVRGGPGVGTTSVLAGVALQSGRPIVAASLAGCEDGDDALRALGDAMGVRPVGDMGAVIDALRALPGAILVADDVANEATWDALRGIADAAGAVWLVAGGEVPDARALEALPEGNLVAARVAASLGLPVEGAVERLAQRAGWLAAFPMGVPGAVDAPAAALAPDRADRAVLRAGIARLVPPPLPGEAAQHAVEHVGPLLALADGAPINGVPDMRDLLLLRRIAALHKDVGVAVRCLAAAARIALVAGQVEVARSLAREALRRAPDHAARGIATWADADALLFAGEVEEALVRYAEATEWLRRAKDSWAQATILRRSADRLAARGHVIAAERHYRQARWYYRSERMSVGIAATLRGAAALAVQAGEFVGAGTLHEQVAAAVDGDADGAGERANLRLGEATLAIARGEYARADRLLRALGDAAGDHALQRASVMRRRADLCLRRGEHDAALTAADQAAALYAALGEPTAHAGCVRLAGDVHAAAGRLGAALDAYREATRLQVRVQDLRGLMRTLEHAAVVAEAAGDVEAARNLRGQRAAVVESLGDGA